MERDWCRNLELRVRYPRCWRWTFPRLAFDLSSLLALLLEHAVLLLSLVSDLNRTEMFRTISSTIQKLLEGTMPQQLAIR